MAKKMERERGNRESRESVERGESRARRVEIERE